MTILHDALHIVLYYLVRPIARRLPPAVLNAIWCVVAVPFGFGFALLRGRALARYLALASAPDRPPGTGRTSIRLTWQRLRRLDYYLRDGRLDGSLEGLDDDCAARPAIWVLCNTVGLEAVLVFMRRFPDAVVVRRRWGGEGDLHVATARPWHKWWAHKAAVRMADGAGREIVAGEHPMAYRRLIDGTRHVLVYQDVWDEDGRTTAVPLFGRPTPLNFGALRLARMASGMPLRFLSVDPDGPRWVLRAGEIIEPTAEAIRARVEQEIRRDPSRWALWPEWLAWLDHRSATTTQPVPATDHVSAAEPLGVRATP